LILNNNGYGVRKRILKLVTVSSLEKIFKFETLDEFEEYQEYVESKKQQRANKKTIIVCK